MRGSVIVNRNKKLGAWLVRLLLALLMLGVALPALPVQPALASANESPLAAPTYAIYTVRSGDTLFSLARRTGSTVPALVALNQLSNPNQIHVGQLILIPATTEDRGSTTSYTVKRGDTLYSLARTYNTTVGVLMWLSNLSNPNQISVGQKLIVPGAGSPGGPTGNPAATRIKFPAGGTSATVTGTISVGQRACYVFGAAAGQTATLQITSPGNVANFDFAPANLAVNGGFPFKRLVNEDRTFSQLLPVTGDYVACVATPSGTVSYALKVTIPPLSAGCPAPNKAIRSTDWNSVVNSDPALKHEVIDGKQYVTVIGSPSSVSGYPLTDQVVYGDFDGNCVEEAALPLESGGTAGATAYLVYRSGSPKPRLIASGEGYKLALSVTPGRLVVTTALYAGWEPNCCPSGLTHTTYRLAGDVLTKVSSTTDGFPAMETPTVEQFYAYLSSRDYAKAYAMFSPAFQASHPFPAFKAGYGNTVSFTTEVSGSPAAIDRVQVTIHAVERKPGGGTVNRTYVGTWDLIWGGSGWLLDKGVFRVG